MKLSSSGRRYSRVDGKTESSLPYLLELDQETMQFDDAGKLKRKEIWRRRGYTDRYCSDCPLLAAFLLWGPAAVVLFIKIF